MTFSRRFFCKNSLFWGLGTSLFGLASFTSENKISNVERLVLSKKRGQKIIVEGRILDKNLNPCQHLNIEIFHDNSELNPEIFNYYGKLRTDANGKYSFETDIPQKHYENGLQKLARIEFTISDDNNFEYKTKLYLGYGGKAYVDHQHANYQFEVAENILPKTSFGGQFNTVEFNFFLNYSTKVNLS